MQNTSTGEHAALWHLIKDIKFAMFTTKHADGLLLSRPMTTQNRSVDEHNTLWFFMSRKSEPVAEIAADSVVNIVYADPSKDTYVSVSGSARIVEDMVKKNELWSVFAKAWFPGGVDNADLALVRVTIERAHYWDVKSSKIVQIYRIAKAAITGELPEDLGDNVEVRMRNTR